MTALCLAVALLQDARGAERELGALLKNTSISVDLNNATLGSLVEVVRAHLGRNFIVSSDVWKEHSEEQLRFTLTMKEVSVQSLLKVTLRPRGLTVTVREGILVVVPISSVAERLTTRIYDVRDLTLPLEHFTPMAVKWGIQDTGDGTDGAIFTSLFAQAGQDTGEARTASLDMLVQLVQTHTGTGTWAQNPRTTLSEVNGMLVITQTDKVHREIEGLLNGLRRVR